MTHTRDGMQSLADFAERQAIPADPKRVRALGDRARRRRTAVGAALVLVLVAGVGGGVMALARPDPDSSPGPVIAHTDDEILGPAGYRGIRLGMSAAEARKSGEIVVSPPAAGECAGFDLKAHPPGADEVSGYISAKHGVVLIGAAGDMHTAEGIRLGSTMAEVRTAYPDVRLGDMWFAKVPGNPEAQYAIGVEGGKVTEIDLQSTDQDCVG